MMRLRVFLPDHVLVDTVTSRIRAEGVEGMFTLLPKHIDYVTVLVPGILAFVDQNEELVYVAVDSGVLVKQGHDVRIASRHAVRDTDLRHLRNIVEEAFSIPTEHEKRLRTALVSLEMDLIRRFIDIGDTRP